MSTPVFPFYFDLSQNLSWLTAGSSYKPQKKQEITELPQEGRLFAFLLKILDIPDVEITPDKELPKM